MATSSIPSLTATSITADDQALRLAVAAFLTNYKGQTRVHAKSDLFCYLAWCGTVDLDPFAARRVDLERYLRWMQTSRRFKPSTVSRRLSVVASFYRTCVIDGVLEHSPAEYVRRPRVPEESPTLGLSHLQFEALLTAARHSSNPNDAALVSMLGLLGLRTSKPPGPTSRTSVRSMDTAFSRSMERAARSPSRPSLQQSAEPSTAPQPNAVGAQSSAAETRPA